MHPQVPQSKAATPRPEPIHIGSDRSLTTALVAVSLLKASKDPLPGGQRADGNIQVTTVCFSQVSAAPSDLKTGFKHKLALRGAIRRSFTEARTVNKSKSTPLPQRKGVS